MKINIFWKKFHSFCTFKLLILLIIVIWLINLFIFHHLKYLSYKQTTVNVLQSQQNFSRESDNENHEIVKIIDKADCKIGNFSTHVANEILKFKTTLSNFYHTLSDSPDLSRRCIKFIQKQSFDDKSPWHRADEYFSFKNVKLIKILRTSKITAIENAPKGTQLKLLAHLTNNIRALIKPKWYSPFDVISGTVYAGKDRHHGEILAFYMSVLLEMPRVPVTVSRKFDLHNEIISKANEKLLNTFLTKDNQTCFYGVCTYCSPLDLLCLDSKILEGAVIYYLSSNVTLRISRHPWRRTYRCGVLARWEVEEDYCNAVRNSKFYSNVRNSELFLDLIDGAIFDFLIDNGDRHHFEFIDQYSGKPRLLLLDNGKSFGNPYLDHIDILAPLYHCCKLRKTTWHYLLQLRGGNLSKWLQFLLTNSDEIIINKMHLKALDRRLLVIFAAVEYCFTRKGHENVMN